MTSEQIEQMRADMDAGTPGPWWVSHTWYEDDLPESVSVGSGDVVVHDHDLGYNEDVDKSIEANARRIARVPDMEAEILRMREIVQRGADIIEGDLVGAEWRRACREFVKDARAALN